MDTLTILRDARDLLQKGWIQGHSKLIHPEGDCYCSTGAIWEAISPVEGGEFDDELNSMYDAAVKVAANHVPDRGRYYNEFWSSGSKLIHFNDDGQTEKADVLAVFDSAIQSLEQEN